MTKTNATIAAEMVDREAIRDVIYRYCRGIDRIDTDVLLSVYWPDATDEHGNFATRSAQEFVDHALPILRGMDQTKHTVTNILIDVQGDAAYVETYVHAYHRMRNAEGQAYDHHLSARYLDRMARRGDEWRIQHRLFVIDWSREFPPSADKDSAMENMGYSDDRPYDTGLRKPDDISYRFLKPAK